MTTVSAADPTSIDTILQVAAGAVLPRCLHAVANLGVADALEDTPQSAEMLAKATGTNPDALARTLRLLAANGFFDYREGLFGHTPASMLLRDDHPQAVGQGKFFKGDRTGFKFCQRVYLQVRNKSID